MRPRPLDVRGVTLRQALDAVVAKDRRYEWRDVDGVVVVRPRAAWRDREHPLLREVGPVHLRDARMPDVVDAVRRAIHIGVRDSSASSNGERRLSLDFAGGTLLDLLNALARAHGRVQWSLTSDISTSSWMVGEP